jgi:Rrf2 family transcriptional regulator, nitric oxide-sensitive transcriptional repressor
VRLLASTDYALRLLMRLGTEPGRLQTSEELAQGVGVPRNHIQKIVQDLAEAGVVRTLRGARGGVTLAHPAASISLGSVVRALESDQALAECFRADGGACCFSPDCRLKGRLWRAREAFLAELDSATLADCLTPTGPTPPSPKRKSGDPRAP